MNFPQRAKVCVFMEGRGRGQYTWTVNGLQPFLLGFLSSDLWTLVYLAVIVTSNISMTGRVPLANSRLLNFAYRATFPGVREPPHSLLRLSDISQV